MELEFELENAWKWRELNGYFTQNDAIRIFHGPGEGTGNHRDLAIDRFNNHYWVTLKGSGDSEIRLPVIEKFLKSKSAESAVIHERVEKGTTHLPKVLFGHPIETRFLVSEGPLKFLIQFSEVRHPGLFLDHAPLRAWLMGHCSGRKVLNAFAYTGSLSVAAGVGGARHVTTLDLSRATLDWALENWRLNGLDEEKSKWVAGDVFEWFPRFKRQNERFDCIILDPPSFSRGKRGNFSTTKDLKKLHVQAIEILETGGILVSSINSANISRKKFEDELAESARATKTDFKVIKTIELPETFPTLLNCPEDRYLKGLVIERLAAKRS